MKVENYIDQNIKRDRDLLFKIDSFCSQYTGNSSEYRIRNILKSKFDFVDDRLIENFENNPYNLANEIIMRYSRNEKVVKYHLASQFISNDDEVSVFEMKVLNSRSDYVRINGSSYVYEIKTENDTTLRLDSQIKDYEKVFEYINVVVHDKHYDKVQKMLPGKVGIITYTLSNGKFEYSVRKIAAYNKGVQKKAIINSLNGQQLRMLLREYKAIDNTKSVADLRKLCMRVIPKANVLDFYKSSTKKRYELNWESTRMNFGRILPIDLQSYYSKFEDWTSMRGTSAFQLNSEA